MTLNSYREMVERFLGRKVDGRVEDAIVNRGWLHNVAAGATARAITSYQASQQKTAAASS